ncbi:hypothetical protein HIM_02480 [Hirsutella minnesotensis 3608]|nr:hypothetical protein HIM_02480 [Hirsutella minnesotensis 3608]
MRSAFTLGLWIGLTLASPQRLIVDGVTIDIGGNGAIGIGTGGAGNAVGGGEAGGAGGAKKQTELAPGGSTGGSAGEGGAGAKKFVVTVGGGADVFIPNILEAAPGSKVEFQFNTGNHTATQGTFDGGCSPLQLKDPNAFHSGHIPYKEGQQEVGTFTLQINDTQPLAILCTTGPHRKNGQVMVINATPEQLSTFSKACMASTVADDAKNTVGGVVGQIPLSQAAFVPLPEEEEKGKGGPPGAAAPPAEKAVSPKGLPKKAGKTDLRPLAGAGGSGAKGAAGSHGGVASAGAKSVGVPSETRVTEKGVLDEP